MLVGSNQAAAGSLLDADIERLYRGLLHVRRVEEETARIYPSDKIKSPVHLAIGQEAISVGVIDALNADDVVGATYRSHATYLAKGGDLRAMMAEMYGKDTGCARGKGGSMHLVYTDRNVLGSSAVVGTTIPLAAGYALALKREGKGRIAVTFFGDGATEEGCFYETLNFAALHKLSILFVCENNGYAIHEPLSKRWGAPDLCRRVEGFGIPAQRIEGGDILAIRAAAADAIAAIRAGQGPRLLECPIYRWREHVGPAEDFSQNYRSRTEAEPWFANDQVPRLAAMVEPAARARIEADIEAAIADAVAFAEASPFPGPEELLTDVYAPAPVHATPPVETTRLLRYVDALREAVAQEMAADPAVFVMGLDVDDHKGIQGSTAGLLAEFGAERIFTTPLSEDAMTGIAIGAAMAGLRPLHVHIRMDFLLLCMNQLINIAAKARYMYGGSVKVPLVVRSMIGKSWGQGAQHSQGLHAMFMHVPGLKVVAPSNAHDVKGLMIAALRDDNPVIFMEHRLLYSLESYVPEAPYAMEFGRARITIAGRDITIVGISNMLVESVRAHGLLAEVDVDAEVIDPITLVPLDIDTILASARRTRRLLVVDNAWTSCGASAEIIAQVLERAGPEAGIAVKRIGFAPTTCPTTPSLEALFYANPAKIAEAAYAMVRPGAPAWTPDPEHARLAYQVNFKGPF